ncbi:PROTEIN CPR-5 [Salix viminalis]|uniref:PROTEIN CPR-5 n=1 Tax=Salix viminalis TaxID=40686 RepID=A0A9Q0UVS0_SALVM|nr:PROTEIN CPR-5 [Salix viminalis]
MTPSPSQPPSSSSVNKSTRVSYKLRSPKVVFAPVRRRGGVGDGDVEAIALPLGMSFAAVVAQVLERKDAAGERMSVDHLSMICTSAVRESLANVFGDKFDFFTRNFQKSFGSTLSTLRLINETSINRGPRALIHQNLESSASNRTINTRVGCTNSACMEDCDSETDLLNNSTEGHTHKLEQVEENISVGCSGQELVLHGQTNQLACAPSSYPLINMYNNMEKSVMEQARSNDLKALEIGVAMKRLKLEEDLLNLTSESNYLERSKLVMGMSRASFKVDKFKTQLEDTRHAELHRKCIDCLVAGLFIMSASLSYSAYVESKLGWFVRAVFILQFLAADTDVSSSSCEPDGVWDPDHSCSCILACTTFLNFKPDNANNFHSATAGSCLWFYRQTLCRYTGRERITLAPVLGSFMLAAVLVNCMHTDIVPCSSRACRRSLPGDKTRHNISILAPAITFLRYFPPFSTTVLWFFAICWPR